jgi:hypothetical protein
MDVHKSKWNGRITRNYLKYEAAFIVGSSTLCFLWQHTVRGFSNVVQVDILNANEWCAPEM